MSKPLRFFIAGIIQGSLPDTVHPQDYRQEIATLIESSFPGSDVFDPVIKYPDSLGYDDAAAGGAFFDLMDLAGRHDVLIAFIPEASMGTAIELWQAYHAGALVVTVSTLRKNWVVRYLSDLVFTDMAGLRQAIVDGTLAAAIAKKALPRG